MNKLVIPSNLRERQVKASDPALSIWVSANAGSGKTHVLTQRVIRLLLNGVPPSKILCLTFTKAAAAQMSERVFRTLSAWTMMDDVKLRADIVETGAPSPSPPDLVMARRLFTRAVETPGGLKIQTIHAFCERLLHLFPFEANVPARFEVADELRTQEMLALAKRGAIEHAQRSEGELAAALAIVADIAGFHGVDGLVGQAMARRAAARRSGSDRQETLAARLGGGRYASVDAVRREMVEGGVAPAQWAAMADVLATGKKTDANKAGCLRAAAAIHAQAGATSAGLQATVAALWPVYFKSDGGVRGSYMTAALNAARPDFAADLAAEATRLADLESEKKIAEAIERTNALLSLVDATMRRYERAKIAGGLLDFDDLIDRTLALLDKSDSGWVLHKLDAGIDHVLVDEAQDTSEAQWKILERLTGDFASGAGARSQARSFFVVGDDKQSIFSFQGAAPLMFDRMRSDFERRFKAGEKPFERVALKTSFRSVQAILDAVDKVFTREPHHDGLARATVEWPLHESIKARLPGLIEIWPRIKADAPPEPDDWSIPLDILSAKDPESIVADRVARKIRQLTTHNAGELVHDGRGETMRPIRPGDILVLVRTRNAFFEAVIRALKQYQVAVAGADRLDVANHIAVMDLVAAGRTALLPLDDLSLACLLKSPLFGFTDDDLIGLAPHRRGPLIGALGASDAPHHRTAHARITGWIERARGASPFAFYIELLGRDGGRKLIEQRLGPEAHDAIDEFLRLALTHEQTGAPSLGRFLAEVEALETTVKRDMEGPGDAVRVMTVHAAKGLEAKIVFLPDTCGVPAQQFEPVVFDLDKETDEPPLLVWSPRKSEDPAPVAAAREAERRATMREYRRLLYVALTRAEERLYVAGFYRTKSPPEDCWNAMIERTFEADGEDVPAFWGEPDTIRRIATAGEGEAGKILKTQREQTTLALSPEWLGRPIAMPATAAPIRPSKIGTDRAAGTERRRGMAYGSALHQLLQHLPDRPAETRAAAGRSFLAARRGTWPDVEPGMVLAEALAVLAIPELAPLFSPGSRAEVAVAGRLPRPDGSMRDVTGTVDRLLVAAEAVTIADFKTGRRREQGDAYVAQLALYRAVLEPLWPGRPVRALLIWTSEASVVELDGATLDAALAGALASA